MIAALLLAVELSAPAGRDEVVARVRDAEVTAAELRESLADLDEKAALEKDPAALESALRAVLARREVKDALVARLRAERAQANRQVYLSKLLEQEPPVIDAAALSRTMGPAK